MQKSVEDKFIFLVTRKEKYRDYVSDFMVNHATESFHVQA